jgi:hypothetical protein
MYTSNCQMDCHNIPIKAKPDQSSKTKFQNNERTIKWHMKFWRSYKSFELLEICGFFSKFDC